MSFPVTKVDTLQSELNSGEPATLGDVLRIIQLGTMLTSLKRVFTGLTASATFDLTAIDGTGETTGASNPNRLPALNFNYLRVDASGTATTVGNYIVGPVGSTVIPPPGGANTAVGVATISDDGKTLTFPTTITGFTVMYIPRAAVPMTTTYARS